MLPDRASLRRQPLFTPIWLAAVGAFLGLIVLACATWVWATADSTTVVVVRHAEKQLDAGRDPPLNGAGTARAELLARMFGDTGADHVDAIYVSPTMRSRMTVAPLAAALGLTPIVAPGDAPAVLARRVLKEHAGGRILIVAHADTMNDIVAALGGDNPLPPVADSEYGTMYIVSVPRIGRVNVLRIGY